VRKIILSTNIAETSITIEDVVYVIDSGKGKEKSYDPHLKLSTLQVQWVSMANARQRKGRAGRVQQGVCFRLFSQMRAKTLPAYQDPELLRTPLEECALQVKMLVETRGAGGIAAFLETAIQPPHPISIATAVESLQNIGALTADEDLTELGRYLAQLPFDPRVGKMILYGCMFGCVEPSLIMACVMSYRDPFVLPTTPDARTKAQAAKRRLVGNSNSDQLAILNAIRQWQSAKSKHGFCAQNFLSAATLNMIHSMSKQSASEIKKFGFNCDNSNAGELNLLLCVLTAGLYPNVVSVAVLEH
jgi:HrpA-like RNA helicase